MGHCVLFTHELVIFTQNFFMASKRLIVFLFLLVVLKTYADDTLTLFSPDHNIRLTVFRQLDGQLKYGVYYKQKFFIKPLLLLTVFRSHREGRRWSRPSRPVTQREVRLAVHLRQHDMAPAGSVGLGHPALLLLAAPEGARLAIGPGSIPPAPHDAGQTDPAHARPEPSS